MPKRDALERIQSDIHRLRQRADMLRSNRRNAEIRSIVLRMKEHAVTPEDLVAAYTRSKVKAVRATVPPKFRNPISGQTWSGRGKLPRWIHAAEHAGGERQQFLIR